MTFKFQFSNESVSFSNFFVRVVCYSITNTQNILVNIHRTLWSMNYQFHIRVLKFFAFLSAWLEAYVQKSPYDISGIWKYMDIYRETSYYPHFESKLMKELIDLFHICTECCSKTSLLNNIIGRPVHSSRTKLGSYSLHTSIKYVLFHEVRKVTQSLFSICRTINGLRHLKVIFWATSRENLK